MTQKIISGERTLSYDVLDTRVLKAIGGFQRLGIGRGDSIALMLRNDFPFFEVALAAGAIGAYSVPVNWHYTADEARYIIENADAKAVVVHADLLSRLEGVLPPHVAVFVAATPPEIVKAYGLAAESTSVPPGAAAWDRWRDTQAPGVPNTAEMPGSMIYTSGTTGHPKGVRRFAPTPEQAANWRKIRTLIYGIASPEDVVLVTGPMYHSAPNAFGIGAALNRSTIILQPRFDPEETLALIERYRVTHVHMVPTMFIRLLKLPEAVRRKYDLSSLKAVPHAAAPCPIDVKRAIIDWFGPVVLEYYGGTETSAVVSCNTSEWLAHPGTVGKALPGCQIVIRGDDGRILPPGQPGEVFVRNFSIADFTYHKDDEKRRASEYEGLLSIGDVGYLDEDGYLYLNDRKRDMIISGGVNIYPAEIEAALHLYPGIADCAVFGIPDAEFGEAVCAVIVAAKGVALDEAAIRAYLRERLAGYMVPKRIEFRPDLPREDSGKVFKRKIRDEFWKNTGRRI